MIHNFRSDIVRNLHAHVSQATRQGKLVLTFAVVFVIAVAAAVSSLVTHCGSSLRRSPRLVVM